MPLLTGEFRRTLDDRFRVVLPPEFLAGFEADGGAAWIAKERAGCLSLWSVREWGDRVQTATALVEAKLRAGRLEGKLSRVQTLGRLLSTRQRTVQLADRGRLLLPEGFREFLGVERGGEVVVAGAAVCIELWRPEAWVRYVERRVVRFERLLEQLSQ